jgi:3-hydroxyacyl-[acyl-carrier-protein] dehydratase
MQKQGSNIFEVLDLVRSEGRTEAILLVNADSEIFNGHFPIQAVVPGACMLQLVKDVLETTLNTRLWLKKAQQIKFMNIVVPGDDQLRLSISFANAEGGSFSVQANLTNKEAVCFKFQGIFAPEGALDEL